MYARSAAAPADRYSPDLPGGGGVVHRAKRLRLGARDGCLCDPPSPNAIGRLIASGRRSHKPRVPSVTASSAADRHWS